MSKKEKRLTMLLKKLSNKLEVGQIESGHAERGVRTNGVERLTTWIDAFDVMICSRTRLMSQLQQNAEGLVELNEGIEQVRLLMESLGVQRCPSCSGPDPTRWKEGVWVKKGQKDKTKTSDPGSPIPRNGWDDCETCDGLGFVEVKK